jgi:hypothetical protein
MNNEPEPTRPPKLLEVHFCGVPDESQRDSRTQPRAEAAEADALGTDGATTIRALKGARNAPHTSASIPNIPFIELHAVLPQKRPELILERDSLMMLALIADVRAHLFHG